MRVLIIVMLGLFVNKVSASETDLKQAPSYRISIMEFDSTIEKGKARIRLVCYDGYDTEKPLQDATIQINNLEDKWKTNDKGVLDRTVKPGNYSFKISAAGKYSINTTLVDIQDRYYIEIVFFVSDEMMLTKKPAIYLYSDTPIDLNLKVFPVGEFTFTYPTYDNGWNVNLTENVIKIDDKPYRYLFWEGVQDPIMIGNAGFIVNSDTIVKFLETKLEFIGLNQQEMNDFIVYWAPILKSKTLNQIYFVCGEEYKTKIADLKCSISPETSIRIFMAYVPLEKYIEIEPQILPSYSRKGFTLVEWGGGRSGLLHPIKLN